MYPLTHSSVSLFFPLLVAVDVELSAATQRRGCPRCGGRLHKASFPRKPRGRWCVPDDYSVRLGLCCGEEGCEPRHAELGDRRVLPPSCLFWGRRIYWSGVVLLVATLRQGRAEGSSANALRRRFGVSRQTLNRWMSWFGEAFGTSAPWQRVRGRLRADVRDAELPKSFVDAFLAASTASWPIAFAECLVFLLGGQEHDR